MITTLRTRTDLFVTPIITVKFVGFDFEKYADLIISNLDQNQYDAIQKVDVATTNDNLHTDIKFKELASLIDTEAKAYFNLELGLDENDLELSCMWANVQASGCRHHVHLHPNSFYSGVIYLNVPPTDSSGTLFFIDPRHAKLMQHADFKKPNTFLDRSYGFTPITGNMILFPSWLEHGTEKFYSAEGKFRVSLSFNYSLKKCSEITMKLKLKS